MQRREFITLVGGAAASLPLAARAQPAGKVYRIGFLSYRGCGASLDPNGPFRRGLREVGYIEGRNLVLECRDAPVVAAARALGLKPQLIDVRGAVDFQDAFAAILEQHAQALLVYPLPLAPAPIGQIVEFALSNKLPGSTFWEGYVEQGFLMFYGARNSEQYRRAVGYVDKVLKGAEPASLPVEQPTKFDLVINLKTAKILGLTIPSTILAQVDEVIE
jgi:putative tryptophan/tyrosine transport system substrate-binding protein